MKLGVVVTGLVALLAFGGVMAAFVSNGSPYVDIAQAKKLQGEEVHVVGDIDKPTLKTEALKNLVSFKLIDEKKSTVNVVYQGPAPANMGEATRVVVVGNYDGSTLKARQLLVKCPSKYEGKKG